MSNTLNSKIAMIATLAVLLLFGFIAETLAQETDINEILRETQKMSQSADDVTMVWWIPGEFWRLSLSADPSTTEAQIEEFINIVSPYTIVVVVDGKMGPLGGVTYTPEADIRTSVKLKDSQGVVYKSLEEGSVGADIKNLLSMMKPIFVNMLGPMGENMHFLLFPAKNKAGMQIANASQEGTFSISLGKREFKWRLPLGSLLSPKTCPKCGEKLSGAYKFCPYDGTRLP
ncbi:MAG: hypothetical protein HY805_10665 [Nitrospirae bacterium]|nr:hypothetical protein [Nitrospirota bacterium]